MDAGDQNDEKKEQFYGHMGCYCGEPRKIGTLEFQCATCETWFHETCINIPSGKCLPFMISYLLLCKKCSGIGHETFQKRQATFIHICQMTLANLMFNEQTEGNSKTMFSKDKEIIPFIDKNWEYLTTMQRRVKITWHTTVFKTMTKETDIFLYSEETPGDAYFGLANQDLSKIGPVTDALRMAALPTQGLKPHSMPLETGPGKRTSKRKAPVDNQQNSGVKQKKSESTTSLKLPSHGYPLEHPFNKDGYRYVLAETDPHAPNRQAFDESVEWAGKPIPGYLYRCMMGTDVLLALHDRATQLKVSDDRLSVTGEKGYSMIRASHGVNHGNWYFEVRIDEMPNECAARLGWSLSLGNLQAPCGYDKFSYSWRSRKGTAFHQSRGHHFHDGGYREGDVLGFYISLPKPANKELILPQTYKDRVASGTKGGLPTKTTSCLPLTFLAYPESWNVTLGDENGQTIEKSGTCLFGKFNNKNYKSAPLVKFKSHLYFEDKDNVNESEKALKSAEGSKIMMYRNGKCAGAAFKDIFEGIYYPAISLYKNATVTANFGPKFRFPPKDLEYKPMSEAAFEAHIEYALADIIYHVENEDNIPDFV